MQPKMLFGDLQTTGVTLTEHHSGSPFANHLTRDALHVILNLKGSGIILDNQLRLSLTPATMAIFHRAPLGEISTTRIHPTTEHHFITLSTTSSWIRKTFTTKESTLHPALKKILNPDTPVGFNKLRAMSLSEIELAEELISPPVPKAAAPFWYQAKIIEILTLHLFTPQTLSENRPFCSDLKNNRIQRIDQSILWLKQNLDQPLDLKSLARSIGIAPHYLSRQFAEATGMTLSQKLRQLRIDKAASLLSDGDYNVTEAAMEVGYNSLSHFTKAFHEQKGIRPSDLLAQTKN